MFSNHNIDKTSSNPTDLFETPFSVVTEFSKYITNYIIQDQHRVHTIVDIGCGDGRLGKSIACKLNFYGIKPIKVEFIDVLKEIIPRNAMKELKEKHIDSDFHNLDFLNINQQQLANKFQHNTLFITNPPWRGYRKCEAEIRSKIIEAGLFGHNEIATLFLLKLALIMKHGDIACILCRRDLVFGHGYIKFREIMDLNTSIAAIIPFKNRIRPASGTACGVGLILVHKNHKMLSWLDINRQPNIQGFSKSLSHYASVIAGPNTGNDKLALGTGEDFVIKIEGDFKNDHRPPRLRRRLQQL